MYSDRFNIQKMEIEDLDEVVSISSSAPNPWSKNMFLEELKNPFSHCFVVKIGSTDKSPNIIGFISFRNILDESELLNICIHPKYRELGLAKRLMNFYIDYCKKNMVKRLYLEVNIFNRPALNLYQSCSFKQTGIRKKFYNGKFDAIVMAKEI